MSQAQQGTGLWLGERRHVRELIGGHAHHNAEGNDEQDDEEDGLCKREERLEMKVPSKKR